MRPIEVPAEIERVAGQPGAAPVLQWIAITDLVVDDAYQRDLKKDNWTRIRKIADRFQWSRFSPVFVAPVEGGRFAIIDGQHRTHAAAICGIESVPCQIVHMTREEQAASFAAVNGMVTKVTGFQILKAAIVAGEKWALRAAKICSDAGCTLMTSNGSGDTKQAGEIYPIALIRKHAAAEQGAIVTTVLRALRGSKFGATAEAYTNDVLKPFFMAAIDRPASLEPEFDLVGFIDGFDFPGAIDRAVDFVRTKRRQGIVGISSFDMVAGELRDAIDKVLRGGPVDEGKDLGLDIDDDEEEEGSDSDPAPSPMIGTRAPMTSHRDVLPARAPAPASAAKPKTRPTPPSAAVQQASGAKLPPDAQVRVKHPDGRYVNKYGTGFTDRIEVAWRTTKDRADAAILKNALFRGCVTVAADD